MKRFIVWVVIIVVLLSAWSWKKQDEMTVTCGGDATVSTVPMIKALDWSYTLGEINGRLRYPGGAPTFMEIYHLIRGTIAVIKLIGDQIKRGWNGEPEGEVATGIRRDVERKKAALLAGCCPVGPPPNNPPQADPQQPPFDPKSASLGSGRVLSGAAKAADALRTAAPGDRKWLGQIPLGVAIAKYESSFNDTASNNVYGGHVGFWQISGPNAARLKLGDRTDTYANARYAYAIWKGRGGTWAKDWTTYRTALSHVGEYQRYAQAASGAAPQDRASRQQTVPPDCPGASTGAGGSPNGLRVASWNTYVHNTDSRVVAGMRELAGRADVIGVQEVSDSGRKQAIESAIGGDFAAVCMNTAHQIWYRKAKFTLASSDCRPVFKRTDSYEGPSQGDRYVNTAVLHNTATGETDTVVNTHQLPRIQKGGTLNRVWPRRIGFARKIWLAVADSVATHKSLGPVIVTGDMNFDGDPEGMYAAAGLTGPSSGNQSGRERVIDRILHTGGGGAVETVLPNYGSDHSPRIVTFPTAGSAGGGPVPASFNRQANPRTVEEAIAWMRAAVPNGGHGYSVAGHCEGWMTRAYGHAGGYPTATAHWNAPGPRHVGATDQVPRGALIFFKTGNSAGHVALSLGGGQLMSTDFDGTRFARGKIGIGPISAVAKWGPMLGWRAPNFRVGTERQA